ncbi:MAG: GAF domain-containing protein, partial [Candidatus Baltobacteraceae bacterium]
ALVYIGECDAEGELLSDACIGEAPSEGDLARAIKSVARQLPLRHWQQLQSLIDDASLSVVQSPSLSALARTLAQIALGGLCDWVCVHIVDDEGGVHSAELPAEGDPLLPQLPLSFLNGFALMTSRIDEQFFEQIASEPETQERLAALAPLSAALLPLAHDGRLIGSIVAFATRRTMDDAQFQAFSKLSALASRAFASVQIRAGQAARGAWSHVACAQYDAEVFSAANAYTRVSASLAPEGAKILIDLAGVQGERFAGTLDANAHTLRFACSAMPQPLAIGPGGAIRTLRVVGEEQRLALKPRTFALIYPQGLAGPIETAPLVEYLSDALTADEPDNALRAAREIARYGQSFVLISSR